MSGLPEGWAKTTLGKIISLKYGKSLPKAIRVAGPFSVYGSNGPVGSHTEPLISGPAIIVGRKGSIGELHLSEEPCYPIDTTYFVDEFFDQSPRFLLFLLKTLGLTELNRASAIPGLNRDDAYALPVLLPPLDEQRRIVAKLDNLFERTRRAREELSHIPRLIENYKKAILEAAFRGVVTKDWRRSNKSQGDWKSYKLRELVVSPICYGVVQPGENSTVGVPLIRVCDLEEGMILWKQLRRVAPHIHRAYLRSAIQDDDILISIVGTIGRVSLVQNTSDQVNIARAIARVRPDTDLVRPDWLFYALQTETNQWKLRSEAREVARKTLNLAQLKELSVDVPSLNEQREIVSRIENAFGWLTIVNKEQNQAASLLDHLDQANLAKAFRGELVPQDPSDEPASVLLERICAARAEQPKNTRKGRGKTANASVAA